MKIKGLSKYEITDTGGEMRVVNAKTGRTVKASPRIWGETYFYIRCDGDRKTRCFTPGFLRFLMKHPDLSAADIHPGAARIKFAPDGTVRDLYGGERNKRYSLFRDVDDVLATALLMKAAQKGDMQFLYDFLRDSRNAAVFQVMKLTKYGRERVKNALAAGELLFLEQVTTGHTERVRPIFVWFCSCLEIAVRQQPRTVEVEFQDNLQAHTQDF